MQHPNAKWVGHERKGGEPRRGDLPVRGVVHTTETKAGSAKALFSMEWPYHIIADPVTRELYQMIRLDRTAYSLKGYSSMTSSYRRKNPSFETNHAGRFCVQVTLIGYARDMHKLTNEQLDWLATEVFAPIMDLTGIPNSWDTPLGNGDGFVLATDTYVGRKTPKEWYNFTGWATHQTSPGQDHWDPGRLNVKRIAKTIDALTKADEVEELPELAELGKVYNRLEPGDKHPVCELMQRGFRRLPDSDGRPLWGGKIDGTKSTELTQAWKRFEETSFPRRKNNDGIVGTFAWTHFLDLAMPLVEHAAPAEGLTNEELAAQFDLAQQLIGDQARLIETLRSQVTGFAEALHTIADANSKAVELSHTLNESALEPLATIRKDVLG
ncbi:MAG: hypothetical protein HKN01_01505 [Acidimicrobiia bacterium]|nr:hypothetical protein [Acidimicrobiia bacterium]